jgi:hypothetical protein
VTFSTLLPIHHLKYQLAEVNRLANVVGLAFRLVARQILDSATFKEAYSVFMDELDRLDGHGFVVVAALLPFKRGWFPVGTWMMRIPIPIPLFLANWAVKFFRH